MRRPRGEAAGAAFCSEPGYREFSRDGQDYPMLTLSVVREFAVVHYFDEGACYLLRGDGVISNDESLDFEILDVVCAFTGEFICDAKRAHQVVYEFTSGVEHDELGVWTRR